MKIFLNTFCKFKVNFSKIDHQHELCYVHCNDEHDNIVLFGESCSLALESFAFLAYVIPMELKVKRTVLLRNVGKYIHDQPVGDLHN